MPCTTIQIGAIQIPKHIKVYGDVLKYAYLHLALAYLGYWKLENGPALVEVENIDKPPVED